MGEGEGQRRMATGRCDNVFFFEQKTAYENSACLVGSEMCIKDRLMNRSYYFSEKRMICCSRYINALSRSIVKPVPYTHLTLPTKRTV